MILAPTLVVGISSHMCAGMASPTHGATARPMDPRRPAAHDLLEVNQSKIAFFLFIYE
tara:strand:+ start:397 stop:570 length:174 start_codon:yes stop_codon:yes gene_type:complete